MTIPQLKDLVKASMLYLPHLVSNLSPRKHKNIPRTWLPRLLQNSLRRIFVIVMTCSPEQVLEELFESEQWVIVRLMRDAHALLARAGRLGADVGVFVEDVD